MSERKVIHKYPIPTFTSEIEMPLNAEILTVQLQYDRPTIWASHWTGVTGTEFRLFRTFATGQEFDPFFDGRHAKHLATVQVESGLVWHVYEMVRR